MEAVVAMNPLVMAGAMKAAIKAELLAADLANAPDKHDAWAEAVAKGIASAVVAHIQANALVTVAVASVSGVTVGAGVSGPGTGTGTIT